MGTWRSSDPSSEQFQPLSLPVHESTQRTHAQSLSLAMGCNWTAAHMQAGTAAALARLTPQQQQRLQGLALQTGSSQERHTVRASGQHWQRFGNCVKI